MKEKLIYALGIAAAAVLAWNTYAIAQLPEETSQGVVFKIIFFHVPMWAAAGTTLIVALVTSVLFLITRRFKFDALAVASTDLGLAFLTAGLVTGSIWGRQIWGIWWTWDARLTSALICWILYAGYLMLRRAIEEPTQRAIFAAVYSIFAFLDVPVVFFSIKWWRTQHPQPVFWSGGSFPPDWTRHFMWNMAAMVVLGVVLTAVRYGQEEAQREIDGVRRTAHAY
jgi:heme exporter protein C